MFALIPVFVRSGTSDDSLEESNKSFHHKKKLTHLLKVTHQMAAMLNYRFFFLRV